MSDDGIPDPTELRKKLGIAPHKPVRPTLVGDYDPPNQGARMQMVRNRGLGVTISDYEDEPRVVDEAESAKIDEILKNCPDSSIAWLKKFIVLGSKSAAAKAIGYSPATVKYWRNKYPEFEAILKFYEEELRLRWNDLVEQRGLVGFTEQVFDNTGKLKHTRVRQDPQFHVQLMKKMDPDWKDDTAGTQINITVVRTEE